MHRPSRPTALKLALFLGVAGLTAPLWMAGSQLYGAMVQDTAQAAWLYDFVARSLLQNGDLTTLAEFNYPQPLIRSDSVPDIWDIILFAPIAWLFEFPRQFGVVQALVMGINALGCAWLASSCGCRGAGILVAGWLGATNPTAGEELYVHRMNAAIPGLAAAALAAWLQAVAHPNDNPWKVTKRIALASILGALAAVTYPPFIVLLAPVGLALCVPWMKRSPKKGLSIGISALALGLLIAGPSLLEISGSAWLQRANCAAMDWENACSLSAGGRLDSFRTLSIFHMGFSAQDWLGNAIHPLTWILAPLALLNPSRVSWVACLVLAGVLAAFSLGPCAFELPGVEPLWCHLASVHDLRRFSTIALVITAIASGVGIESAWNKNSSSLRLLALIGGLAAFVQAGNTTAERLSDSTRWLDARPLPSAELLSSLGPGPVAELPYDSMHQFFSAIHAPHRARTNPYHKEDPPPEDPFLFWLHALGSGKSVPRLPTVDEARASGVRWVIFEPQRCAPPAILHPVACEDSVARQLERVLGPRQEHPGGLLSWAIP